MGVSETACFNVTVTKKEVVAAVLPLQEHWLSPSNLDLLLPPVDVSVFFCYGRNPGTANFGSTSRFGFMVEILKKALAQTLVSYYAFAGEIVANSAGEPELLCNNCGVELAEAFADVELKELNFYNPDESIEGKLVPKKSRGVLAVQVTELKCGGLVVACTFDHRIADAYSANMFLVSWAELAQPKSPIPSLPPLSPSFRRSLLNPRRPPSFHPSINDMYIPVSMLPPPTKPEPGSDLLISRIYYITAEELNKIQLLASADGTKRTKLESFSAFLWKMVAKSANRGGKEVIGKMGIVVDGRTRLGKAEMGSYFGNVLSIPYGGSPVEELAERPLSWVASRIHEFLESAVTEEHFLDLIDWVEVHRPVPGLARIYANGAADGPAFVVSSGQRFPASEVDFGWGRPVFGSYHFPWGGSSGYVMPMPSPAGKGDWVVYMHLLSGQMKVIEKEAYHVFRPLTWDYLKN